MMISEVAVRRSSRKSIKTPKAKALIMAARGKKAKKKDTVNNKKVKISKMKLNLKKRSRKKKKHQRKLKRLKIGKSISKTKERPTLEQGKPYLGER